ncbi:MAG: IreB family regulatory phosphoprotein [Anaerovoracaceae bacterium]|nr:IreB family regulatory phosphoprotein [Anaerovoracaceae bacterium]
MEKSTRMFDSFKAQKTNKQIVKEVYDSLKEKDYNPIDQLVGYIISGDPSYITSYNNARTLIKGVDRDDLVAEMLRDYIDAE